MLINIEPYKAAMRPLAALGAGAFLCDGALAGSHAGDVATRTLPRLRWAVDGGAVSALVRGGYRSNSNLHNQQQTTLINPAFPGVLGPHPVREPVPV